MLPTLHECALADSSPCRMCFLVSNNCGGRLCSLESSGIPDSNVMGEMPQDVSRCSSASHRISFVALRYMYRIGWPSLFKSMPLYCKKSKSILIANIHVCMYVNIDGSLYVQNIKAYLISIYHLHNVYQLYIVQVFNARTINTR